MDKEEKKYLTDLRDIHFNNKYTTEELRRKITSKVRDISTNLLELIIFLKHVETEDKKIRKFIKKLDKIENNLIKKHNKYIK